MKEGIAPVQARRTDAEDEGPLPLARGESQAVPRDDGLEADLIEDGQRGVEALKAVGLVADREALTAVVGDDDPGSGNAGVDQRAVTELGFGLDHGHCHAVAGPDGLADSGGDDRHLRRAGVIVIEGRPGGDGTAERRLAVAAGRFQDGRVYAVSGGCLDEVALELAELEGLAVAGALRRGAVGLDELDRPSCPAHALRPLLPGTG